MGSLENSEYGQLPTKVTQSLFSPQPTIPTEVGRIVVVTVHEALELGMVTHLRNSEAAHEFPGRWIQIGTLQQTRSEVGPVNGMSLSTALPSDVIGTTKAVSAV